MRVLAVSVALTMVNLTAVSLSSAAAPALEPGVALALAQWRAKHYRDVRYALRIELREGSDLLQGNLELQVKTPRKPVDLVLRSEEHTSELQSPDHLVCRLLLEKKKKEK